VKHPGLEFIGFALLSGAMSMGVALLVYWTTLTWNYLVSLRLAAIVSGIIRGIRGGRKLPRAEAVLHHS
jgi:hypothetical protein